MERTMGGSKMIEQTHTVASRIVYNQSERSKVASLYENYAGHSDVNTAWQLLSEIRILVELMSH